MLHSMKSRTNHEYVQIKLTKVILGNPSDKGTQQVEEAPHADEEAEVNNGPSIGSQ